MKPLFNWRHQYDQKRDKEEGDAAATINTEPSLTQQSFREDADINVLAKRFGLTDVPLGPIDPSAFRDTTHDPDLRQVLEYQRTARDEFMRLPAKLRRRFHDSPQELWDFIQDPENQEEIVRLGLLTRPADAKPANSTTTSDSATPAPAGTSGDAASKSPPTPPKETPKETPASK